MSVWLYMTCLDHDPPLLADDESGQHLSDLPEIRETIANRDALVAAHDLGAHAEGYFLAHSMRFLAKHRRCKLGITDEYGQTYPTTEEA